MKALSVKQPWANLIAFGAKTIETRTKITNYRGPLLIVSSKEPNIHPAGCAVAIVDLVDSREMISEDIEEACCPMYPNAKSWIFENIRKIKPIPVKGSLGIYNVDWEENDFELQE